MKNKIFNFKRACPAKLQRSGGFTLVEMLVAVSLFIIVATISIGAILTIFDANKKAQSSKTVVDNLNLSIENMARTIRFGTNYHCGDPTGDLSAPRVCNNNTEGDTFFAVTFYDNDLARNVIVKYQLSGIAIQMSYDGGPYSSITAPETNVQLLRFRVFNTDLYDNNQPYVIAVIKGYVGNKPTSQTSFSIETLMSQRKLDYHLL
ncbi:MAG: type II secretion system protein [Candidatus Zambryskibacteria bacterium]